MLSWNEENRPSPDILLGAPCFQPYVKAIESAREQGREESRRWDVPELNPYLDNNLWEQGLVPYNKELPADDEYERPAESQCNWKTIWEAKVKSSTQNDFEEERHGDKAFGKASCIQKEHDVIEGDRTRHFPEANCESGSQPPKKKKEVQTLGLAAWHLYRRTR